MLLIVHFKIPSILDASVVYTNCFCHAIWCAAANGSKNQLLVFMVIICMRCYFIAESNTTMKNLCGWKLVCVYKKLRDTILFYLGTKHNTEV